MKKHTLDLAKFRSYKSVNGMYEADEDTRCAMGKIAGACGAAYLKAHEWLGENLYIRKEYEAGVYSLIGLDGTIIQKSMTAVSYDTNKWGQVISINDSLKFKEADNLALQLAVESGEFEFINALPDEQKLIETTKEKVAVNG